MQDIRQFLKYIHGNHKSELRIYKYWDKEKRKCMCPIFNIKNIEYENKNGDIYYIVNSGGKSNSEITKFNASFVDFDCGRDEDGEYYPLEVVKEYKVRKQIELSEFQLKPTFIIETRNGFHYYWVYNLGENVEAYQWIEIQEKLIKKFSGDKIIKNPARLMRLPFTKWMKDPGNPFDILINQFNDIRYSFQTIQNALSDVILENPKINEKPSKQAKKPVVRDTISNIDFIKKLDVNGLKGAIFGMVGEKGEQEILRDYLSSLVLTKTPPHILVDNRANMYQAIYKLDMIEFLGLSSNYFDCIFHDDNSCSASIFTDNDTGHYIYKCFSSNCNFPAGNILTVVERLSKCNKVKALNFIKDVYNIELKESDWQVEQKEILQANKDYLYSNKMQIEFPELYKRIRNYVPLLIILHDVAIDNVYDLPLTDNDKVIFFSSIRYLQSLVSSKTTSRINDRINLFTFLELLEKLNESDLSEKLLNRAKHEAAKYNHEYIKSHYSIPSYSYDNLNIAEENAKLFSEKNMTMKGWSRELLLRTFGNDTANKVYPQMKEVKISKSSNKFADKFINILLDIIDINGYATERQCLAGLEGYNEKNHIKIKRILQETIELNNLKRIRATKELKKLYKMDAEGYPFIIVRN